MTDAEAQLAAQQLASNADTRVTPTVTPEGAFTPPDAGRTVTAVPDEVVITEADIDAALAAWDEVMPEYAGLLEAQTDA